MSTGTVARDGVPMLEARKSTRSGTSGEGADAIRCRHLDRLRKAISGGDYDIDSGLVADSILRLVGRLD